MPTMLSERAAFGSSVRLVMRWISWARRLILKMSKRGEKKYLRPSQVEWTAWMLLVFSLELAGRVEERSLSLPTRSCLPRACPECPCSTDRILRWAFVLSILGKSQRCREHSAQTTFPHERQWCLLVSRVNLTPHPSIWRLEPPCPGPKAERDLCPHPG